MKCQVAAGQPGPPPASEAGAPGALAIGSVSAAGIQRARERLRGHVRETPCFASPRLSQACEVELFVKHEYQQVTGSFKERGACNRLLALGADERARGVVAASAGNHALGLAYHGQRLGVPVRVLMPRFAPMVKVAQCRAYGAQVELCGDSFDEARAAAAQLAAHEALTLVHGFDDPLVIEGQGTIGLELCDALEGWDALVVPTGGGGLIAGVALAVKSRRPEVEIIGVEAAHAPTVSEALAAGQPVNVRVKSGLADGLAVARVGEHCFPVIRALVSRVECVEEAEIGAAIVRLMEMEKAVVEGAGAVGVAWLARRPAELRGRRVLVIASGGNIDLNIASRVIERGLAAAGRLCRVAVQLSDTPGALARLLGLIASTEANLIQVHHDRNFAPADVTLVNVSLVLETRDRDHIDRVSRALASAGLVYHVGTG
ncbi:MAG TPA: threonine ammonia-lyase [Polyangiaceae bacterium]|nr:threonine ammonia-lyase [Polyangiaceae bacterium]